MVLYDFIRKAIIVMVTMLCLPFSAPCASAEDAPKRVMILNPYSRDTAPFASLLKPFRSTLAAGTHARVDFQEIPLDLTRFGEPNEELLVEFLAQRLERHPVDLVVPIGGDAAAFAARNRARLFPDTPLLITGASAQMLPPGVVGNNATLVTQPLEPTKMIRQMMRMKPETKHIAFILGSSEIERKWATLCRREFTAFSGRVQFIWLDDLPLGEVLNRASNLPPDSFIYHGMFIEDADGIPCGENEALKRLHEVANAPIFSSMASEIGLGVVGGQLFRNTDVGSEAGRIAARILNGESADSIPPLILDPGTPVYDWRELRRWNIREANLPADRILRFREPSFWERYRWQAIATTSFLILQALLIIALLISRSRRREAEKATALIAEISAKFVNLPPDEVDHEITGAMQLICSLLNIDLAVLWQWSTRTPISFTASHFYSLQDGLLPAGLLSEEHFPWYKQELSAGKTVALRSLEDLPDAAATDKESCRHFGVRSSLTLPLSFRENSPIGIISFITTQKNRKWPQPLIDRLQLVASIFASTLARKRADEELLESELRLSLATDAADAGLWVLEIDTETFWANEKARQLFGYHPDEAITLQRFETSVHPEDWPRVRDAVAHSISSGINMDVEYRINTADDSDRWLVSRGRAFSTTPDKPRRLIGLTMDISARRLMEHETTELREDLAQVGRVTLLGNLASSLAHEQRAALYLESARQSSALLASSDEARLVYNKAVADLTTLLRTSEPDGLWNRPLTVTHEGTTYRLRFAPGNRQGIWDPEKFTAFTPASEVDLKTIKNRNRIDGVGAALVGIRKTDPLEPFSPLVGVTAPVTAVVDFKGNVATLTLIDPTLKTKTRVAGTERTLDADFSAPLAYYPQKSEMWEGLMGAMRVSHYMGNTGLFMLQPYDPDRIPLIFVHGLISTPRMWRNVINEIETDPVLRARYQCWVFSYPTGNPPMYSALRLREELDKVKKRYPDSKPKVLVGHSMGGILSHAQVTTVERHHWNIAGEDKASLLFKNVQPGDLIDRATTFQANPHIARTVFICTPHRGSDMAIGTLGGIGRRLISLPGDIFFTTTNTLGEAAAVFTGDSNRLPTSVDGLSPRNPSLKVLDSRPMQAPHHSIIGDRGKGDTPDSSDGVVAYWSSDQKSAKSQKIVPGPHGSCELPETLDELRRILRLHVGLN